MKKILILPGGGIKGLIQLPLLMKIEGQTKKPIYETFDLIVGSSVGAITGGILSAGKFSVSEYYTIFNKELLKLFHTNFATWFRIVSGKPKYKRQPFYDMMEKYIEQGNEFPMNQCKTKFMCTSVNLCDNRTHFFKSWEKKDGKLNLSDSISRSFAAPYYFGMKIDNKTKSLWVDGGIGETNCPIMFAYVEAIRQQWIKTEEVEFTVIGTGYTSKILKYEDRKKTGTIKQILKYLSPSSGGFARIQTTPMKIEKMKQISTYDKNVSFKYYDVEIQDRHDTMDEVKYRNDYINYGVSLIRAPRV